MHYLARRLSYRDVFHITPVELVGAEHFVYLWKFTSILQNICVSRRDDNNHSDFFIFLFMNLIHLLSEQGGCHSRKIERNVRHKEI